MRRIKILCYHKILNSINDINSINVSPENFEEQLRYLVNNFDVISLDNLEEEIHKDGKNAVAITFDDGCSDVLYNALPILERYNVPATLFITTGNIGIDKENWMDDIIRCIMEPSIQQDVFVLEDEFVSCKWDSVTYEQKLELYRSLNNIFRYSGVNRRKKYTDLLHSWSGRREEFRSDRRVLNELEIKKLSKNRLISIGAHTVTHPSLKWMSLDEKKYEIKGSIQKLKEIINRDISLFAYPFGSKNDFDDAVKEILKHQKIKYAFTTLTGELNESTDNHAIPRSVVQNYSEEGFKKYICKLFNENSETEIKNNDNLKSFITYIGKLEDDKEIIENKTKFIIWGCGTYGKALYKELEILGVADNVIFYGDNNPNRKCTLCNGIKVLDSKEIKNVCSRQNVVILVKGIYDWEICLGLIKEEIRKIHIITRT